MSHCNCDNLLVLRKEPHQIHVKECQTCKKEFAYCFCDKICKEIKSSKGHFYQTCADDQCIQITIRCQFCNKLCNILVSRANQNLFWGCECREDNNFFKGYVESAARKYVRQLSNLTRIDEEILCNLIFRNVDFFHFKKIVINLKNLIDVDILFSSLNEKYPDIKFDKTDFGLIHTPQRLTNQNYIENQFLIDQNTSPTTSSQNQILNIFERLNVIDKKIEEFEVYKSNFNNLNNTIESRLFEINEKLENSINEVKDQSNKNYNEIQRRVNSIDKNYNKIEDKISALNKDVKENFLNLFQKLNINDGQSNQVRLLNEFA